MPRQQTSDQAPTFYGFPVVLWSETNLIAGQVLAENGSQYQMIVVTSIDVVCRNAGTNSNILIGGLTNTAGLFGGATGAGLYDTFSWRGYLALPFGALLRVINTSGGGWDSIGAGFVIPNPFALFP